ncbi:MAG: 4Fe-4S binding protein [Anaerolineae bacterium]
MAFRFELTRWAWLKGALKSRFFQPMFMLLTLFFFVIAITAGFFGTPAGSHNFSIIFVWIVWWALLIIVMVPFFGRMWCIICPIPGPGEWLQRRGIIQRTPGRLRSLRWRWPRRLRNMWLQNFGFLAVAVFSTLILTRPGATAWLLLGMLFLGVVLSILYENRVFCRYVCPVGGFIGLYSLSSSIELRVKDVQVCKEHTTKDCVTGTSHSYGCPWMVFPGNLERNTYCGLCTECLKACPRDNIAINLRPFGADLLVARGRGLDEAYKALIMLACAMLYSLVLLGPWGWLKDWANMATLPQWAVYAAGFLAINLLAVPGLFLLTTVAARLAGRLQVPVRRLFVDYAYSLVPIGLIGWIAFSLGFVFVNGSYALSVVSDPFGWGWDLFGTRSIPWTPFLPGLAAILQTGLLMSGLVFSIFIAYRIGRQHAETDAQAWRGVLPVSGFLAGVTLVFLRLYLG